MEWDVENPEKPCGEPTSTYGPYSCKAIPKILTRNLRDEQLIVFSGGLPRQNSDKYTVSVIYRDKHVCFDFTSKVSECFFSYGKS